MTTVQNRWGGARARSGATDTTMLIWKVIQANPGLTRDEILEKIGEQIPAGWAKRRYVAAARTRGGVAADAVAATRARRYVITDTLSKMRELKSVERDADGRYRTLRPIKNYWGDTTKIDETGGVAAEHLNAAYALKTLRSLRARAKSPTPRFNAAEYAAFLTLMDWAERRMKD